ncbi:MAG: DUF5681 domain-containing protein [Ginsengibacter sp.]
MPFKKGQSGNIAGKPKGATNKTTADLRNWINEFINKNRKQIEKDWKTLDPKDRIVMFEKLLKFSLPTLQATSLTSDFDKMTDYELNTVVKKILNSLN